MDDDDGDDHSSARCSPPASELAQLPPLIEFKHTRTKTQVYTHRSFSARPNAVFEDPPDDIAPDNEVLEFVGDSVLSLAVASLIRNTYRMSRSVCRLALIFHTAGLRVGPHAVSSHIFYQISGSHHATYAENTVISGSKRDNSPNLAALPFGGQLASE